MKKLIILAALMVSIAAMLPQPAQAVNIELNYTRESGALAVTNTPVFYRVGAPVEYIVVNNTAKVSNTVTVAQYDAGVVGATLYSGALAAGATAWVYPFRVVYDGNTSNRQYMVTGLKVVVASSEGATNGVDAPVDIFIQSGRNPVQ